ncbi:shikimate dehydrogenase (NADP(+)) [Paraliobacillus quinghaiensis]|uniref:Shikimate dehydrogenase (NADP(+)) n=1 Tax=Paraliobacillus quinghaiensis TaxID=470815 RepID=A0A917WUY1_9BACI|nr:shikimate dehydrogenase [Paraliobacillus quinghaiensis]GGM31024.1 shikimate dehydrogenase (NADP(+)) [Paraliobacillus quinghaiensis]
MKLGLIGQPIKHSLSPLIHQQFLLQVNDVGSYQLYETNKEELPNILESLKEDKVNGFNVTVPYKEDILHYLDALDPYAEQIGAVNTVLNQDGNWIGYNTDGIGYVTAIKSQFPQLFTGDKRVLILGAGGAARGIYYAICQERFQKVDIANRTIDKAKGILALNHQHIVKSSAISFKEAEEKLGNYDLVIQTTSVGMKPETNEQIISLKNLKPNAVASDIVYQPLYTQFLTEAKQQGAYVHLGHTMLLYQAKVAFELWSGQEVSAEKVLPKLEEILKKDE